MGVKYVIAEPGKEKYVPSFLKLMHRGGYADIYENTRALPRAHLSDTAIFMRNNRKILWILASKRIDFTKTIYVQWPKGIPEPSERSGAMQAQGEVKSVEILHDGNAEIRLLARSSRPRWLCLSDTYEKNWRATVNGRPAVIYKANGLFRAIQIPEGTSHVRFYYVPTSFYAGTMISLATLLGFLAAALLGRRRRKNSL